MRTLGSALVFAVLLVGCGGGDDNPSLSAEETAQAWVDAINAEDYERACELSVVKNEAGCLAMMEKKPFGQRLRLDNVHVTGDDEADFSYTDSTERRRLRQGQPPSYYGCCAMRRYGDEYRVHFEVSVIK